MKKILIVTTHTDIETRLEKMILEKALPEAEYSVVVEFFESTPYEPKFLKNFFGIDDLRNRTAIEAAKLECKNWGPFDIVLATDEYAVYLAAEIREYLKVPGMSVIEAIKFRDKVEMKKSLLGTNVPTPKLYEVEELLQNPLLFPVVAKPRSFAGSKGIQILKSAGELASLQEQLKARSELGSGFHEFNLDDLEFEEFISGQIFHIDGLVMDGKIIFCVASEYHGNCLAFMQGAPLGSVSVADEKENKDWLNFAQNVNDNMKIPDGAFHLEAFKNPNGERVFLEIGIRPGGSFVVPAIAKATGLDLDVAHLQCQLKILPKVPLKQEKHFGWLIFAKDYTSKTISLVSKVKTPILENLPSLKWHQIAKAGDKACGSFSYLNNLGAFVFNSTDQKHIHEDLCLLLDKFKVERTIHA